MRYAVIRNETVDDVIECNGFTVQSLAKVMHCTLVPCEQYAVQAGDVYRDWKFYRDGEQLARIPTTDEKISVLEGVSEAFQERISSAENALLGLMSMLTGVK